MTPEEIEQAAADLEKEKVLTLDSMNADAQDIRNEIAASKLNLAEMEKQIKEFRKKICIPAPKRVQVKPEILDQLKGGDMSEAELIGAVLDNVEGTTSRGVKTVIARMANNNDLGISDHDAGHVVYGLPS